MVTVILLCSNIAGIKHETHIAMATMVSVVPISKLSCYTDTRTQKDKLKYSLAYLNVVATQATLYHANSQSDASSCFIILKASLAY